jgi:prepilin-type N-terminal cleavage/methylation domain-containing protein
MRAEAATRARQIGVILKMPFFRNLPYQHEAGGFMETTEVPATSGPMTHPLKVAGRCTKGFTLVELLIVVGIVAIVFSTALPIITTTITSMHLGSAASSLAGAIQSTRYQAISIGCPYTLTVLPASNSYQLATEPVSGTPPSCGTTYVNVNPGISGTSCGACPIPFASADISTTFNTPILLNPSGTVAAVGSSTVPASFSIVLAMAGSAATKTVSVTGVGNVKVSSP